MKRYNLHNSDGDFITVIELDDETWQNDYLTIDDCEPVWNAMPEGTFPDQPNDWFHLEGDAEGEFEIVGFDGIRYASIVEIPATIDYYNLTRGQESGIILEGNNLTVCNWAYEGGIQVEGIIRKNGKVDDIKSLLDYEIDDDGDIIWQYRDVLDDNNDLQSIISDTTPGEYWEIEDGDGDTITVIAPDRWN